MRPEFNSTLGNVASVLNQYPQTNVEVVGHTDSTGDAGYNKNLSVKRAQAVSTTLQSMSVAPGRLFIMGMGESQPIASNAPNPALRAKPPGGSTYQPGNAVSLVGSW